MRAANGGEVGKILYHRCALTTKGQIDEIGHADGLTATWRVVSLQNAPLVFQVHPVGWIVVSNAKNT